MSTFAPGSRLQDRFTLVERIGAGGMSEVWRATDEVLGRPVAVKVLAAALADVDRLTWREARAAARLAHPNVTQVYDYGEVPLSGGGSAGYLVMELVDGQNLASRLTAGPLPWREAARVARQVAAALAAAHRLGVIHRDIKPGNVVLTGDGVKVLDFGIAAAAGGGDTDPGRWLGTPRYAAPERSDVTAPARPASDVYSLGVLFYEALAGHPPDRSPPPPVPGVPEPVMRLCGACLEPDPARRPDARQVSTGLAEATGEPMPAASVTAAAPAPVAPTRTLPLTQDAAAAALRRGSRRAVPLAGAALAAIVVGLLLLAAAVQSGDGGGGSPQAGDPGAGSPTVPAPESPADQGPGQGQGRGRGRGQGEGRGQGKDSDLSPEVVTALALAVEDAFAGGTITGDAHEDLGDGVDDLREAFQEEPDKRGKEVDKAAAELRKEVDDLREDGEIDPATAARLTGLLDGRA